MISNIFAPIGARIFGAVSLALLLTSIGLAIWGNAGWNRAADWQARSEVEASNHRQTKANYRLAQAAATERQKALRQAEARKSYEIAERLDHANAEIDRLRGLAGRFGDARSLQACRAIASGASDRPVPIGEDQPAPHRDGPGADAVVLTRPEFDELVDNTLRLERVRQWGQSLITEGLAIPAAEFGTE